MSNTNVLDGLTNDKVKDCTVSRLCKVHSRYVTSVKTVIAFKTPAPAVLVESAMESMRSMLGILYYQIYCTECHRGYFKKTNIRSKKSLFG